MIQWPTSAITGVILLVSVWGCRSLFVRGTCALRRKRIRQARVAMDMHELLLFWKVVVKVIVKAVRKRRTASACCTSHRLIGRGPLRERQRPLFPPPPPLLSTRPHFVSFDVMELLQQTPDLQTFDMNFATSGCIPDSLLACADVTLVPMAPMYSVHKPPLALCNQLFLTYPIVHIPTLCSLQEKLSFSWPCCLALPTEHRRAGLHFALTPS